MGESVGAAVFPIQGGAEYIFVGSRAQLVQGDVLYHVFDRNADWGGGRSDVEGHRF